MPVKPAQPEEARYRDKLSVFTISGHHFRSAVRGVVFKTLWCDLRGPS